MKPLPILIHYRISRICRNKSEHFDFFLNKISKDLKELEEEKLHKNYRKEGKRSERPSALKEK